MVRQAGCAEWVAFSSAGGKTTSAPVGEADLLEVVLGRGGSGDITLSVEIVGWGCSLELDKR